MMAINHIEGYISKRLDSAKAEQGKNRAVRMIGIIGMQNNYEGYELFVYSTPSVFRIRYSICTNLHCDSADRLPNPLLSPNSINTFFFL